MKIFDEKKEFIDVNEIKDVITNTFQLSNYNEVRELVNNTEIKLTEDEIKKYLDERLSIERPELKESIANREEKPTTGMRDSKEATKIFMEDLEIQKYKFEPYVLKYYKRYINILKTKLNKLFGILDQIQDEKNDKIFELLNELDITINDDRQINRVDAERLLEPILQNLSEMLQKAEEANKLNTYLKYGLSNNMFYRRGLSGYENYPRTELQVKNLDDIEINGQVGCIPITEKQKKIIKQKESEYLKWTLNILDDIDDEDAKQKVLN